MKTGLLLGLVAISFAVTAYAKDPATGLKTDKQKFSYTVGFQLGTNLKRQNLDLDPKIVSLGIQHALTGATPKMSQEEMHASVQAYQKKEQEKVAAAAKKNLDASHAFLEANKKKPGVVTLPSGLEYKIITER